MPNGVIRKFFQPKERADAADNKDRYTSNPRAVSSGKFFHQHMKGWRLRYVIDTNKKGGSNEPPSVTF